jgi:hypothetical protein
VGSAAYLLSIRKTVLLVDVSKILAKLYTERTKIRSEIRALERRFEYLRLFHGVSKERREIITIDPRALDNERPKNRGEG